MQSSDAFKRFTRLLVPLFLVACSHMSGLGQTSWHTIAASGDPSALLGHPLRAEPGTPPSRTAPWTYGFTLPAYQVGETPSGPPSSSL